MTEFFSEYWQLVVFGAVITIAAVFIIFFAAKATSSHAKAFKQQEKMLRELAELKEKYRDFTAEKLSEFPDEEILKGVNVLYQSYVMKQDDPEKAFLTFNEEIQNLYVLEVLIEDETVKEFFGQSDMLLTSRIVPALEMIGMSDFAQMILPVCKMYDKDDETTSLDVKVIERLDEFVLRENILGKIKLSSAEYIRLNADRLKI